MKLLTKEEVGLAFSRAAITYDEACDFQKETGLALIDRIISDGLKPDKILDVGMGTGRITRELSSRLNRPVHGCDIAWGVVSYSQKNGNGISGIQADAEHLPFTRGVFDIVFSNIVYQWVGDPGTAFSEAKRVMKRGGRFYFSILVKDSLSELYETLDLFFEADPLRNFLPSCKDIDRKFRAECLRPLWIREVIYKKYYRSCLELLRSIKMVGAGRVLENNLFGMGQRGLFIKALKTYDDSFCEKGKVFATYKVIFGCVEKK